MHAQLSLELVEFRLKFLLYVGYACRHVLFFLSPTRLRRWY
jgi:hypothetical protein